MKKHLFLWVFVVSTIFTVSCKKDSGSGSAATDTYLSVIVINFPTAGSIAMNGSSLNITGTITDNDNLSTAKVEIRNKATGVILNQQTSNTGNVSFYHYTWNWTVTGISSPTPAAVKIIARDKNGFEISKEVDITLDN